MARRSLRTITSGLGVRAPETLARLRERHSRRRRSGRPVDGRCLGTSAVWRTPSSRRVGGEAPVSALRPVVSSPPPSEPDVRVPPHPALHEYIGWCRRPGHHQRGRVADQVPQIAEPALGIVRCPHVQLALVVEYPLLRLIDAGQRRAGVHRRPPPIQPCRVLTGPLRHVAGFPDLGLVRVLRHAPAATADGAPAPHPPRRVRRAPPGRFPRSPQTARQGRRSAVPRGHRRALPQHGTRPRPPEQKPVGRDDPEQQPGSSTPTAHSRQFRGCCPVSGLQALIRLLRLSALLPHPARWRRTAARSSGAAPTLHRTSGIRLPLSFTRPSRRPGARSLTPPGHMAPRGAVPRRTRTGSPLPPRADASLPTGAAIGSDVQPGVASEGRPAGSPRDALRAAGRRSPGRG